jgi:hypothetical protein
MCPGVTDVTTTFKKKERVLVERDDLERWLTLFRW